MNADDITLLHTGVFVLTSGTPKSQQQALLVNFSRLNGRDPGPSRHCVFMFLMYSLNSYTQEHGLIVLMSLPGSGVRVRSDNGKMLKESHRSQVFWVKSIFLIHDPNDHRQILARTFAAMIASVVKRVLENHVLPQMIVAPDRAAARRLLELHAVDPRLVPEHLGGQWSYASFYAWLDALLQSSCRDTKHSLWEPIAVPPPPLGQQQQQHGQQRLQQLPQRRQASPPPRLVDPWQKRPPQPPRQHRQLAYHDPTQQQDSSPVIGTTLIWQAGLELQSSARPQLPQHLVKLRNSQTAKYRYERRKREVEELRRHERELRRQNALLHSESFRLETLLDHAKAMIQQLN